MDAKTQQQYAETFHALHKTSDPLVLFNAWDAATAPLLVAIAGKLFAIALAVAASQALNRTRGSPVL